MAGRKAIPFNIIENENGKKPHRSNEQLMKRAAAEPKIDSAKLKCPSHLTPEVKREWKKIVALYRKLDKQVITDLDVYALEVLCESIVTYRKAMEKLHESSEVYTSRTDPHKPRKNPWVEIAREASDTIKKYSDVLLLDPVSRARVGLAKAKEENLSPMEQYFKDKASKGHGTQ